LALAAQVEETAPFARDQSHILDGASRSNIAEPGSGSNQERAVIKSSRRDHLTMSQNKRAAIIETMMKADTDMRLQDSELDAVSGGTAVEYPVMLALIIVACITGARIAQPAKVLTMGEARPGAERLR
jgi:hypothetical protein